MTSSIPADVLLSSLAAEPMADPDLSGRTLGEFVLREQIGEGGYGAVYRCEQPVLKRDAVVKVLHARRRRSNAAKERFLREAQLASRLDHPYAAHVYAFGAEDDGVLWIAMELVQGTTLDDLAEDARADAARRSSCRSSSASPRSCTPPTSAGSCIATSSRRT